MSFDPITYALVNRTMTMLRRGASPIYGVAWDRGSDPTLTRIHDSVGMIAAIGIGSELVRNDFDAVGIFGEMRRVADELGNEFVRIPKCYIRKVRTAEYYTWEVSKTQYAGFYLPWCFWDFDKGQALPHVDVGAFKGGLDGDRLTSVRGQAQTYLNIVTARTQARKNNDETGREGYQQYDLHVHDLLQTLFVIEFATLHSQGVHPGFTSGRYNENDTIAGAAAGTNSVELATSTAEQFVIGQSISIGSTHTSEEVTGRNNDRVLLRIDDNNDGTSTLTFDGDPVTVTTSDVIASRAWRNGFSDLVAASSGALDATSKSPFVYRGIESPYGDIYTWMDGLNVTDYQSWVARNAADYTSNLFAHPYERLGYVTSDQTGSYVTEMGFDPQFPFAELPTALSGSSSTHYADYYYSSAGSRVARVGGYWLNGSSAGLFMAALSTASSLSDRNVGARLLAKAL